MCTGEISILGACLYEFVFEKEMRGPQNIVDLVSILPVLPDVLFSSYLPGYLNVKIL